MCGHSSAILSLSLAFEFIMFTPNQNLRFKAKTQIPWKLLSIVKLLSVVTFDPAGLRNKYHSFNF